MTNDKLREALPCPFCGGPAEPYPDGDMEGYSIMCKGSPFNGCCIHKFGYPTHEEAVAAWNTRALAAPVEAEPVAQEKPMDQAVTVTDSGITVNVGRDGAWVIFRSKSGKSCCFQPVQHWSDDKMFAQAIHEWARDMQEHFAHPAEQGKDADDAIPREPTEAMLIAGCDAHYRTSTMDHVGPVLAKCWRAITNSARNAKPAKGG